MYVRGWEGGTDKKKDFSHPAGKKKTLFFIFEKKCIIL